MNRFLMPLVNRIAVPLTYYILGPPIECGLITDSICQSILGVTSIGFDCLIFLFTNVTVTFIQKSSSSVPYLLLECHLSPTIKVHVGSNTLIESIPQ